MAENGGTEMEERKVTVKVTSEEREAINENLAADLISKNIYVRIYMALIWVGATIVMCLFIKDITTQYLDGKSSPSSSITLSLADELPVPKVIVCNWNQDGTTADPTPTYQCPQCNLTLVSCNNLNITDPVKANCSGDWVFTPIQTKGGLFHCYTYNGNNETAFFSNTVGYSGSIATVWSVDLFPPADPSAPGASVNRAGLQASFIILDGTPTSGDVIYDEVRFAPVGLDTFFAIKYVNTLHQEDNPASNTVPNSTRYDTVVSGVNLLAIPNDTVGFIGVSFAFQTLNQEQDIFFTSYTLQNFWGDFAGMVGTLMGLDVIKVASGIPVGVVAVRLKSLDPLEDHFNG